MGRPYSLDLRQRVVGAVHGGMSCEEAAEHYEVSESSVIRWVRRERETGMPAALAMGGSRPFALAAQRDWLLARVAAKRDITLRELADRSELLCCVAHPRSGGHQLQKSLRASEQDRPDCRAPARTVAAISGQD